MAGLTEKQQQALAAFKEATAATPRLPRDDNDADCLRFLRARQYDVTKSVEMYNNYVKWRLENNIDAVLEEGVLVPREKWLYSYHGKDKQGRPIFVEKTGHVDIKQLVEKDKFTIAQAIRGHIRQQEFMYKLYEKNTHEEGRLVENGFTILDLENASIFKHLNGYARQFFGDMASVGQNYYPERMGKMIVVNAPRAFPMAWNFIKGFLDVNTQNKIEVLPFAQAKARLAELIDLKYLPKQYGGECDCEANGCFKMDPPYTYEKENEAESVTTAMASVALQNNDEKHEKHDKEEKGIKGSENESKTEVSETA